MRQHKVRLDDGSEIPLDLQKLKDWYAQGLLRRDSPVLRPGAKQWLPLNRALDLPSARRQPAPGGTPEPRTVRAKPWRTLAASLLLLVAGAGGGYFWWRPERWLPALDPTPWREISLGLVAAGLLLVRGWEWGRRIVRTLALAAALATLPLGVILALKSARLGAAFLVLAAAALFAVGLFLLLAGRGSWLKAAAGLLFALGGGFGALDFGLVSESDEERRVREALLADEVYADPALGIRLELREGWRRLRPDQGAVSVPPAARVVLARPRQGGFAYLTAEDSPRGVLSADDHLQRVLAERLAAMPELTSAGRHEVTVGGLAGRGATSYRTAAGQRVRDVTAVWRHGWTWFALVAWVPDGGQSAAGRPLAALHGAFSHAPGPAQRLAQAVEAATRAVPLLSPAAAELLVRSRTAEALAPEQALRHTLRLAAAGLGSLPGDEAAELAALGEAVQQGFTARERTSFGGYLDRLRSDLPTSSEEDRAMGELLRRGLLQLPSARLARLQDLYAKALAAALKG
jgi:hypothetical protein